LGIMIHSFVIGLTLAITRGGEFGEFLCGYQSLFLYSLFLRSCRTGVAALLHCFYLSEDGDFTQPNVVFSNCDCYYFLSFYRSSSTLSLLPRSPVFPLPDTYRPILSFPGSFTLDSDILPPALRRSLPRHPNRCTPTETPIEITTVASAIATSTDTLSRIRPYSPSGDVNRPSRVQTAVTLKGRRKGRRDRRGRREDGINPRVDERDFGWDVDLCELCRDVGG
jgi:hypothetical protein